MNYLLTVLTFTLSCLVLALNKEKMYYKREFFKAVHKIEELSAENHNLKVKYDEIPVASYDVI